MPSRIQALSPDQLRLTQDPDSFTFETTSDLEPNRDLIGQPRVVRALEYGLGVASKGYNIALIGLSGSGRSTAIFNIVADHGRTETRPNDWVYVYNFEANHRPQPISLPAGEGQVFHDAIKDLVESIKDNVPQAFESLIYRDEVRALRQQFDSQRDELLGPLRQKAADQDFALYENESGIRIWHPSEDKNSEGDEEQLSAEDQQGLRNARRELESDLDDILRLSQRAQRDAHDKLKEIDRNTLDAALQEDMDALRERYKEQPEVLAYLDGLYDDLADQVVGEVRKIDDQGLEEAVELRRYDVNVFVDNSKTEGAPVLVETNPTYENLFGRLEPEAESDANTHFMRMKAGGLHQANGGYLVIAAGASTDGWGVWDDLFEALETEELEVRSHRSGSRATNTLWPDPIPLKIKIVLMRSPRISHPKLRWNEDFLNLFKVRTEFNHDMVRDADRIQDYATFIAGRCEKDNLRPFDRPAVAKIVEYGSRLSGHQQKLTAAFGTIADIAREADYWAGKNEHETVTAEDVLKALGQRADRAARQAEYERWHILEGFTFITLEGVEVGQVNGLSIFPRAEFSIGVPSRITAQTYMGDAGVIDIEREIDMSGPTHDKGVLTLSGYLGRTYAQDQPLSLTASLTMEQNYGGIDGDSASSTELYALLSSLSRIPINQAIAVTGSVNQRGEVQPIGGVNEKIEGFFEICKGRGLTGEQGVMIPHTNVADLMLSEEVVEAVANGQFHIWPVRTIDEGIELLTGSPAGEPDEHGNYPEGTVHHAVKKRLRQLALDLENFGNSHKEDQDDN